MHRLEAATSYTYELSLANKHKRVCEYDFTGKQKVKPFLSMKSTRDRTGSAVHSVASFASCSFSGRYLIEDLLDVGAGKTRCENEIGFLAWCLKTLMNSQTAAHMIDEAASEGWSMELDDLEAHDFHLDVPEKRLVINAHGLGIQSLTKSEYFGNLVLASIARAFRDIWQEKRHGGFEEQYGPESILMLERIRAADCDTLLVAMAWEMKEDGHPEIWRHIIGSDEGDMAMVFASSMEYFTGDDALYRSMYKTFRQWFISEERINVCDHETLEYLDTLIAQEGAGIFGQAYLNPLRLEVLSCLPDRHAYLQGYGGELITDPLYAGMSDMVNQAHFMQIMHDMQATTIAGVPFRSGELARRIFPEQLACDKIGVDA